VESRWVRYEWECFRNEINSARKNGYIIPVVEGMSVGELPFGLRHGQAYTSAQLDQAAGQGHSLAKTALERLA